MSHSSLYQGQDNHEDLGLKKLIGSLCDTIVAVV